MEHSDYLNAGGYGFWCGKRCVEKKQAAGKRPIFGKGNKAAFDQEQIAKEQAAAAALAQAQSGGSGGGGSSTGLIIAAVLGLAVIGGVIYFVRRKK